MNRQLTLVAIVLLTALQSWAITETTIHAFAGGAYSEYPLSGLIFDFAGNAYGTASGGGNGYGTIYELSPSQSGWTANIIYSFDKITGAYPSAALMFDKADNLYGVTAFGGSTSGICNNSGCGTVFELARVAGGWNFQRLYEFQAGADGAYPMGQLVFDSAGNLFGTASDAGALQNGTVFELSPLNGSWSESTIYTFAGNGDASGPIAGLTAGPPGIFYGTTLNGGSNGVGAVYQLTYEKSAWKEIVVFSFSRTIGSNPQSALLLRRGKLFGTTQTGGSNGDGTVFSLSEVNHAIVKTVLYNFTGAADGADPYSAVVADAQGNLYGTTLQGGGSGYGVVYQLRDVSGTWKESVLHSFSRISDGSSPLGTPVIHGEALFGTTSGGGKWDGGVAWEITPN
jgi:uncharacterized repeat protein (TIGR03803 family)